MKQGTVYKVIFGKVGTRTVVSIISFEGGDDAIKLARIAADCPESPMLKVEASTEVWVA